MLTSILSASTAFALLAAAQEITSPPPTTLQKRYTPPPGESCFFVCADYFDDCGNTYGPGCFTSCPHSPKPTFTTPYCDASSTSTVTPGTTTGPSVTVLEKRFTPPPGEPGTFLCKDYFDDCGNTYGPGCYTSFPNSPEPTFTTPVCDAATTTSDALEKRFTPPPGETGSYICQDYFDECGNTYGPGCYLSYTHSPSPTFTTPVCNVATSTAA